MKTENEVIEHIKRNLLLVRLELEDTGLTYEDIGDDHLLLDSAGLGLDSVEALDLLVGSEKAYGFQIKEIDKELIESACHSVRTLAAFILNNMAETALTKVA
ncbi:MAG: acyl carrier protein [Gammaproteobacteria bacterium]|nr:acyl carrier protein [Gammaproteobacteria bacterium]